MAKIDFKKVKLERIEEIKKQMKKCAKEKRWIRYYNLKQEKINLEKSLERVM